MNESIVAITVLMLAGVIAFVLIPLGIAHLLGWASELDDEFHAATREQAETRPLDE